MALLDDLAVGGNVTSSLAIGMTALIVWPVIGPLVRPLAKTAIKGGILVYRETTKLYEATAGGIGDLMEEAARELGPELAAKAVEEIGAEIAEEAIQKGAAPGWGIISTALLLGEPDYLIRHCGTDYEKAS